MKSIEKLLKQDALTAREAAILKLARTFNQYLTNAGHAKAIQGLEKDISEALALKEPGYMTVKETQILSDYSAMYNWLQFQLALMNKRYSDYKNGLQLLTATLDLVNTNEKFLTEDNGDNLALTFAKFLLKYDKEEAFYSLDLTYKARSKIIDFNAVLIALCEVYEIPNLKYLQYKGDSDEFNVNQKYFKAVKEELKDFIADKWEIDRQAISKKFTKSTAVMTTSQAIRAIDLFFTEELFTIPAPAEEKIAICKNYFKTTSYKTLHKESQEVFVLLENATSKLTNTAADLKK